MAWKAPTPRTPVPHGHPTLAQGQLLDMQVNRGR